MSIHNQIHQYVSQKIAYLRSIANQGAGRGILANLRRGVGKSPGELPELWGVVFDRMPDELFGQEGPSDAEWAVYTALTLYAMHQQGNEENMHTHDVSIGTAAACLVKSEDDTDRILKRLNLIATANTPVDLAYHLRGLIQLLKGESAKLDYARLAKELYLFRYPDAANEIKIAWGRDFYHKINQKEKES